MKQVQLVPPGTKKRPAVPNGITLSPYVSFLWSNGEGTYTRRGVILWIFNGLTKREFSKKDREGGKRILFPDLPPRSTEPHARVVFADSIRGEDIVSKAWVPLRDLVFHLPDGKPRKPVKLPYKPVHFTLRQLRAAVNKMPKWFDPPEAGALALLEAHGKERLKEFYRAVEVINQK